MGSPLHLPRMALSLHPQPQTWSHSTTSPEPTHLRLSSVERFSGETSDCRPFLTQSELHFEFQAAASHSYLSKIAYMISFMSGRAKAWATAEWNCCSVIHYSLPLFEKTFTALVDVFFNGLSEHVTFWLLQTSPLSLMLQSHWLRLIRAWKWLEKCLPPGRQPSSYSSWGSSPKHSPAPASPPMTNT